MAAMVKRQSPQGLAVRGLTLIAIPIISQLALATGMSLLYEATEIYARQHARTSKIQQCLAEWGAADTHLSTLLTDAAIRRQPPDQTACEMQLAILQGTCRQLQPVVGGTDAYKALLESTKAINTNYFRARRALVASTYASTPTDQNNWVESAKQSIASVNLQAIGFNELDTGKSWMVSSYIRQMERRAWMYALSGGVLISASAMVLLFWFFSKQIISRLATIRENSKRFATGQPLCEPLTGDDEIAQVDSSFHAMANAVREATRVQSAMITNSADLICSLDTSGRFITSSAASHQMLGVPPSALAGKPLLDYVHPDDQSTAVESLQEVATKYEKVFELRLQRADGSFVDALWSSTFSASDGSIFSVVHDNSLMKNAERLQQEVVQMVSHDLRSPLAAISGFYEMLDEGLVGTVNAQGKGLLDAAARNATRMVALTQDLLDLAKLEAGRLELQCETVPVQTIFAEAVESVSTQAQQKTIRISIEAHNTELHGDKRRLVQVLVNLLSNAIKFTPENGTVTLTAHNDEDQAIIRVADSGRGIAPDRLAVIFDRYKQAYSEDSLIESGKGIGLSICKALVELHGGCITVDSKVGSGTVFTLELPHRPAVTQSITLMMQEKQPS